MRWGAIRVLPYYAAAAAVAVPALFPLLWILVSSFKSQVDIIASPPRWIFAPVLHNYLRVFGEQQFLKFLLGSTLLSLALGLPAAFSIPRFRQTALGLFILVARLMPGISFLLPWYILFSRLHLIDTYTAMIARCSSRSTSSRG